MKTGSVVASDWQDDASACLQGSWWELEDADGRVWDPTAEQFGYTFPYYRGKGCGFLSREPSKRCNLLLKSLDITCPLA